ncbi:MAG: tetratricopeptide repeat protein [Burkholderiales bacterium]|nr:tetratricopeptide repeat protein [Burkholderiales bacterium]
MGLDYYGPMSLSKHFAILAIVTSISCSSALAADKGPTVSNSALGSELFYQLLVGELSAQNGDAGSAFSLMLDAARKANSEQLYERAVNIALNARNGESALIAAKAWSQSFAGSVAANRYVLQILIALNRISDTVDPIRRDLSFAKGAARIGAITLLPRYFVRASDKKQAATTVELALTSDLSNKATGAAAWASVGTMRLLAGDLDGALNAARRGAAINPQSEEVAALALGLWDARMPEAEELVQKQLAGKPKPEFRLAYARRLAGADRLSEAYVQAQQVTKEAPTLADGWLVQGTLEYQGKKPDAAEASLKKFIAQRAPAAQDAPQDAALVQAYLILSQIAEQMQHPDEALAYLQKIDSAQDILRVQGRKAALLAKQGKLDEARALLRDLPEKQPEDARLKINAEVQLLRENRQFTQAYEVLADAIRRFPDDMELVYEKAMAAEKIGKLPEMEQLLRKVIAARPDYQHAYNALGYSLADRNLRLPEARELINKALELAPQDPFIMDSLGWLEFRSGNLQDALRILNQAYQARPDAEIAAHLGEVLWAVNRRQEAIARWKEGTTMNPDNDTLQETMRRLNRP